MSIGMTYDDFWRDDPTKAKMYRRADLINKKNIKWQLYEEGVYTYEALCKVSPVLHAFAKNGTKPLPFSDKPYNIEKLDEENAKRKKQDESEKEQQMVKNERLRAQIFFDNWYRATKKHFEERQENK